MSKGYGKQSGVTCGALKQSEAHALDHETPSRPPLDPLTTLKQSETHAMAHETPSRPPLDPL
eukprot:3465249-Pyramimonas_sp.AAC.1